MRLVRPLWALPLLASVVLMVASAALGWLGRADRPSSAEGTLPAAAAAPPSPTNSRAAAEPVWVGIVVVGLGPLTSETEDALALPAPVGLAFMADWPGLTDGVRRARATGHETYLQLPVEPLDATVAVASPQAILTAAAPDEVKSGVRAFLGLPGEVDAAVIDAGAFARLPDRFMAAAEVLAEARIGLIELGGSALKPSATTVALPFAESAGPLDSDLTTVGIDAGLANLEARARNDGGALGFAHAYPVVLARIRAWAAGLASRGITLAPPTRAFAISRPQAESG